VDFGRNGVLDMARHIKVIVRKDGGMEWDYNGFQGDSCKATQSKVMKALKKIGVSIDATATISTPKIAEALGRDKVKESF